MSKCNYCLSADKECRPYGEKGSMICFDCMKDSPTREAEAQRQFGSQLAACGAIAVAGTEAGPYPFEGSKQ